jgi:hypothetical protein
MTERITIHQIINDDFGLGLFVVNLEMKMFKEYTSNVMKMKKTCNPERGSK